MENSDRRSRGLSLKGLSKSFGGNSQSVDTRPLIKEGSLGSQSLPNNSESDDDKSTDLAGDVIITTPTSISPSTGSQTGTNSGGSAAGHGRDEEEVRRREEEGS